MSGRIAILAQARLGSSRLPCKSLLTLRGLPVIDWVWQRLQKCASVDTVIVAIPDTPLDSVLAGHLSRGGIQFMAGPEQDVLRRMALAARMVNADYVVRVCADNPFVWSGAIDSLVEFYSRSQCDYAWNHVPRDNMWPDGLGAEMTSAELLFELERVARLPAQREHCFNYIWDNRDQFRMATFDPPEGWLRRPDIRLDIDTESDFQRLSLLPVSVASDAAAIIAAWDGAA